MKVIIQKDYEKMCRWAAEYIAVKIRDHRKERPFVLGLPMLLHDPIPGPETENAVYATRHGAAVWLHPGEHLAPAVAELLSGDLKAMGERGRACAHPRAATGIAARVLKLLSDAR